jgi:subtilisin family serine protease
VAPTILGATIPEGSVSTMPRGSPRQPRREGEPAPPEATTPEEPSKVEPATPEAAAPEEPSKMEPAPPEATTPEEPSKMEPATPEATTLGGSVSTMPPVSSRPEQFLIAKKAGPLPQGVQPLDLNVIEEALKTSDIPGYKYVKKLTPPGVAGALTAGLSGPQSIIVCEMPREHAEALMQSSGGQLIVERDRAVALPQIVPIVPPNVPIRDPGVIVPQLPPFAVTVTVSGRDGSPVEGANVYLYGSLWPTQGVTDGNGQVQLTLFGETAGTIRGLYVNPKADYWSLWIRRPAFDPNQNNVVHLTPLDQQFPNFPDQQVIGWGIKAMKVDQLPPNFRGQGVKVAVVDSGAATTHEVLAQVKGGLDIVAQPPSPQTWNQDIIAHGSHCAGVIAGLDKARGRGIRGIAPDAAVYAYKVFPGGRFSDVIDALNRCIEQQIDVVNLSLGSDQRSELLEQKIQEAKQLGVACIVAAGNSGGPVQHPATSPHVLAVAAIGRHGEFPPESYHSTQVFTGEGSITSADGYFSAKFTCFGPEIGVCAPGVAILSSVPSNNYAVWDGTSMAAPHVTGLAALVLAHHPDFQGSYRARNAQRVERLFQLLKQSTQPLNLGDPQRTGAGMPDALRAINLARGAATAATVSSDPTELLQRLLGVLQGTAVPQGNGGAAGSTGSAVQQLRTAMQQAGLLPGGTAGVTPQTSMGAAGGAGSAMQQLKAAMQQAGLL